MDNTKLKDLFFNRKRLILLFLLTAVILLGVVTLTSCGNSVSDIVIKDSDMPRTTYVQGQELDLSNGVLTALTGGNETSIPMTDPEVSVSGYDNTILGKQTVTVTYKGKDTSFEVTVVARMVADGYKSEYFIGDSFDGSQGRLKITGDDGKTTTVSLNSELVTIKPFNTEVAGDSVVTVTYNDNNGASYETSFTVKVYAIDEIKFTKPSKTVYSSHESELSLAGGYFTVKASGTELFSYVNLTTDMYDSGFDLSAATAENRDTPLEQTVLFTYAGETFEFKISILYSGVSVVKDAAKALASVNLTGRDVEISPEMSAIAVDAANEYFKLTKAKKDLIDEEDVLKVMRPAAICVFRLLNESAVKFENSFKLDPKLGNLLIQAQSYDRLKEDMKNFENKDDPFNVCAVILNNMKEEFKDTVLFEEEIDGKMTDVTVESFIKSPSNEELSFYVDLFKYMLNVSDILAPVPDNWTKETLSQYETYIKEALNYITGSKYIGPNFNGVYDSISSWRTNDDYFEIIYTYYLYVDGDTESFFNSINSQYGLKLHLPGDLQSWYTYLSSASYELTQNMMGNINNMDFRLYDTTYFMYYYCKVLEFAEQVKSNPNTLYKDIYDFIDGDYMTYSIVEHPQSLGYLYHTYPMVESEAFLNLWNSYIELVSLYFEGNLDFETDKDIFDKVLSDLAELTPGEFYGFICSLNFLYSDQSTDKYAFDPSDRIHSTLAYLMAYYGDNVLGDNAALIQLFFAMEKCALIEANKSDVAEFRAEMDTFLDYYGALSNENQAKFQEIAGALYTKYLTIYNEYGVTQAPELGATEGTFNDLKATIADFYTILEIIYDDSTSEQSKDYYSALLFALSEKAISLYTDIQKNGTDEAVKALYTIEYSFSASSTLTIDSAVTRIRFEFYYNMIFRYLNYGTEANPMNISFWLFYSEKTDLRGFMIELSDLLMANYKGQTLDANDVRSIIEGFRELENDEMNTFYLLGINIYYDMLLDYFDSSASDTLVRAILQMEIGYTEYMKDAADSGRLKYLEDIMTNAETEYGKLSTEDLDSLDQMLKEFYSFYLEKYNEIKNGNS